MKPHDDPEVAAWLAKAAEDLAAARVLERHAPHLDAVICFHCQQAVEKGLKAVLVALDQDVPRTHDLDVLLAAALTKAPELSSLRDTASYLNGFSVVPRYPAFQSPAGDREARSHRACTMAAGAEQVILAALSVTPLTLGNRS